MILPSVVREIVEQLRKADVGVRVQYGHDTPIPAATAAFIMVEPDEGAPDQFEGPLTTRGLVSSHWTKWSAVRVLVHTQSTQTGAAQERNQIACEALADAFLVALSIVSDRRRNPVRNLTGTFLAAEDGARQIGARYQITFQLGRPVNEQTARLAAIPLVADLVVEGASGPDTFERFVPTTEP